MTFFASAERSSEAEINESLELICNNPVVDSLMLTVNGFLAILNKNRQILAVNNTLLGALNIKKLNDLIGLRPGEALSCIHAKELPSGCGTSKFCSTCGAAIAVVTSLNENIPTSKRCAIATKKHGIKKDLFLEVQAQPITIENKSFLLLFLQDITNQQKWARLEKNFFHDMNNIAGGLIGLTELLMLDTNLCQNKYIKQLKALTSRLHQEILVQKYLTDVENQIYKPLWTEIDINSLFADLELAFTNHKSKASKEIFFEEVKENITFKTDITLLRKTLESLILNALEASPINSCVKVFFNNKANEFSFYIWNNSSIPGDIAKRIFQRNFTTKTDLGHGMNLYSIKLFCEEFLNAKIDFKTSEEDGTTFFITLRKEN
jgi:K+-sensing histidine kinase KdpD